MPDFPFDARDLVLCQRLVYTARVAAAHDATGGHRVRRAGEGQEFLDFRPYVPGDDPRRIDWTVFARLRQPYVRVLQHETALYVHILLDLSQSMAAGAAQTKAALACRLGCALAYVALRCGDRVSVGTFSDNLQTFRRNLRGKPALGRIVQALRDAPFGMQTDLARTVQTFRQQAGHRGLVVVLSDFLAPGDWQAPLRVLLGWRCRLLVVQVLDPIDWGQQLDGVLRLKDSETGRTLEIRITESVIDRYRRRVREHARRIESFCLSRGQGYLLADTRDGWNEVLARCLRNRELVR